MDQKRVFVWIDLEMTGLSIERDVILEIAVVITDSLCNVLYSGTSYVIHQPSDLFLGMDDWCTQTHTKSGLVSDVKQSRNTISFAQDEIVNIINQYAPKKCGILAGNSVWQDRLFLAKYMPKIIEVLHYRILDVSSIKELALAWYSIKPFKKSDSHRALPDIHESIKELLYYKDMIFQKSV